MTCVNLDTNPPQTLTNNTNATFRTNNSFGATADDTNLNGLPSQGDFVAIWSGPGQPTRQLCANQISTQGTGFLKIKQGTALCIKTIAGHFAFLSVGAWDDNLGTYQGTVTLWPDAG